MTAEMPNIEDLKQARDRLAGKVRVTPLLPSAVLSDLTGAEARGGSKHECPD